MSSDIFWNYVIAHLIVQMKIYPSMVKIIFFAIIFVSRLLVTKWGIYKMPFVDGA